MTREEYLKQIDSVIENGKFKDNWQSLTAHQAPSWYTDAKLGLFIHWGVYSVPAFHNEWYSREMYDKMSPCYHYHIRHFGTHDKFGYKDFIPMFKAEKFNAESWISLFEKSGAKYIMPVAEHHDGYAMYDTEFNNYNAVKTGPKRDVLGEIKTACEKHGLVFCASNHRAEHYFFMNMGKTFNSDVNDKKYDDFYGPAYYCPELASYKMGDTANDCTTISPSREFLDDWLVRCCELVDKYKPRVVYFDWWIHNKGFKPYLKKFAAYYYNRALEWGEEVTINYKQHAFAPGAATHDVERSGLSQIAREPWQTCTAIAKNSWGYTKNNTFKTPYHIITDFIDIVSKNGNMLLNVGPKSDGTITNEETEILLELGKWLKKNGEGIYSTQPWLWFGEGKANAKEGFANDNKTGKYTEKDFRFTYKDGYIYAFWMKPSEKRSVKLKSFKKIKGDILIKSITLLENGKSLDFLRNEKALEIIFKDKISSTLPVCFKLETE